jgi:hypothetical protein
MWTNTVGDIFVPSLWMPVDFLLKDLGTTTRSRPSVVHRAGDKTGGQPGDSLWTAVDNLRQVRDCGQRAGFVPWLSTCESPVDNAVTRQNSSSPQYAQHR